MTPEQKEYNEIVAGAAEDVILAIDVDDADDLDEVFTQEIDEIENMHPWVLDEDKAIQVLRLSNFPTAEFFHHGTCMKSDESNHGKASFPFATCAGAALAEDVKQYMFDKLGLDSPLNVENVRMVQAKLELEQDD